MIKKSEILLEEKEINALKVLSDIVCTKRGEYIHCCECPLNINNNCVSTEARDVLVKYREGK